MTDRLDDVVAEWARRTPDAPAVLCDGTGVGYAELVARAAAAAEAFRRGGVVHGAVVPVAAEPSVELVASVLGCLRAGGIAVVLGPAWPSWCAEDVLDRAALLSTSDTAYVVCAPGLRPRPIAYSHKEVLSALAGPGPAPTDGVDLWSEVWAALLGGGCVLFEPPVDADVADEPEPPGVEADYPVLVRQVPTGGRSQVLAEARRILGDESLTPDDDLLDAGMNSLDAIRLATVLSVHGGRKVTVGDLYRERRLNAFPETAPAPAAPVVDHGPPALTHAQKRFLFAEAVSPGSADNIVVEAYELTGPLDPDALRAAFGDVVARHEALSGIYVWERGLPVHRVLGETVPWSEVPPPAEPLPVQEVAERIAADLWDTPFRLDRELPVRARLCLLAPDRALLCLQFHHIAFDGSSELPLLTDLRHAYLARAAGEAPRFTPAPGYHLAARLEERGLATWATDDLPYWREVLADCAPSCLPPVPTETEAAAHETVRHLDAATVRLLKAAVARHAGPPLSALAAGAAMALARRFDVDDVCVGTLTAGRFDPTVDELVGYLVNPFAVPLRGLRRNPGAVLAAAAGRVVAGLDHARTPFDEVVRALRGTRPWFEAWVVLQHPPPAVSLGPVGLRPIRVRPPRTSRSWLVEVFPTADGRWDVVTTWRADVLSDDAGELLADDLVAALTDLAGA